MAAFHHNRSGSLSTAAIICLLVTFALSGACLRNGLSSSSEPEAQQNVSQSTEVRPIESLQVGDRVIGVNPTGDVDTSLGLEVDPATWKKLTLRAAKEDGSIADIILLRPDSWLQSGGVMKGSKTRLSLTEIGVDGEADIIAIEPCPPIQPGTDPIITGTFRHTSKAVLDLRLASSEEPIGTTANHPFWSEDRQQFVRADSLKPGEQVRTMTGTARVASIQPRGSPDTVFNIEVLGQHVYRVGNQGVLVHNLCEEAMRRYRALRMSGKSPELAREIVAREFPSPILLGRDMSGRVGPVANSKKWKTYDPRWAQRGVELEEGAEYKKAIRANAQWIRDQVAGGRRMYDIGGDSAASRLGHGVSDFYEAEKKVLKSMGYRRVPRGSVSLEGEIFPLFEWVKK